PHLFSNHHRISTNLSFTHSRLVKVKAGPSIVPGTLPVEGDLAESWTQPNDRTYVFKLRKGVRWHPKPPVNGRELTAEDVKYTYERFLSIKGNPNRSMLGAVEKIDAPDKYTVRFMLNEPSGWFVDYLAQTVMWVVPREAVEQFGDREPFKDVRVRRALALAMNWKEVLETNAWSQGHGVPNPAIPAALKEWSIPINQLSPEGRRHYEQNIPEAKRLLTQAGFPNGLK